MLAKKYNISTTDSVWRDIAAYNNIGNVISGQVQNKIRSMIRKASVFHPGGHYWQMCNAGQQYWDGTTELYDGSESVIDVMESFGYVEQNEVDAFVRWMFIDWDWTFQDVALQMFDEANSIFPVTSSDPMVQDQRGFITILTNFMIENSIPDPIFDVRVSFYDAVL
jgi:hypothetical protein